MAKPLFIAEKPSVAAEFAKALKMNGKRRDGYVESENGVVTWCVGHLVTMSYPEVYDERLKRWSLETLPFIPEQFLYEVIPSVKKQFEIVKGKISTVSMSVRTPDGKENISTGWWNRWQVCMENRENVSGSIPRRKKRF